MEYHEDEDETLSDTDLPDESDMERADASVDTQPCPYCGKYVYEEADVCSHCGSFILPEISQGKIPRWIFIGIVLGLIIMVIGWVL